MACDISPWPCIGEFWFLAFGLSLHPLCAQLLDHLKHPSSSPRRLLDIGTCLGQGLRHLVFTGGVPAAQLFGTDILPAFEEAGCALFDDVNTFKGHFIAADFLSGDPQSPLMKTQGEWGCSYGYNVSACLRPARSATGLQTNAAPPESGHPSPEGGLDYGRSGRNNGGCR
ncbi:MAG: hypothetical protein LQ340_000899 [Diploschistes diacapsis]|nr:MAG: hypothetical protein LQ340_000899 [Diploschistes diacapsis]